MNRLTTIAILGSLAAATVAAPAQAKSPPPHAGEARAASLDPDARAGAETQQLHALWSSAHYCPVETVPDFYPQTRLQRCDWSASDIAQRSDSNDVGVAPITGK